MVWMASALPPNVNMEFWQIGPDILAAAQAAGIDDFFAFGEVYDQVFGSSFMSEFSIRGKLQSTIDFGFQMADRTFASQSGPTDGLRDFFASDDYYTDADSNAYIQPTFTGNHDMGRIGYFLVQDNPGAWIELGTPAGPGLDVFCPRHAGHLLRRRAGFRRRRRR
jgi:hypothetical protein